MKNDWVCSVKFARSIQPDKKIRNSVSGSCRSRFFWYSYKVGFFSFPCAIMRPSLPYLWQVSIMFLLKVIHPPFILKWILVQKFEIISFSLDMFMEKLTRIMTKDFFFFRIQIANKQFFVVDLVVNNARLHLFFLGKGICNLLLWENSESRWNLMEDRRAPNPNFEYFRISCQFKLSRSSWRRFFYMKILNKIDFLLVVRIC